MRLSTIIAAALMLLALGAMMMKAVVLVMPLVISAITLIVVATAKIYIGRKLSSRLEENEDTIKEKLEEAIE